MATDSQGTGWEREYLHRDLLSSSRHGRRADTTGASRVPRPHRRLQAAIAGRTRFRPMRCNFFDMAAGGFPRNGAGMPLADRQSRRPVCAAPIPGAMPCKESR
ncbi:hypothetical protein BCEP4_1150012 [Burkholderia cepacia]|nr:hypothetical protein BCEP4_1150012 [Burkholderia cepacia]